ncbi:MAG TPA: N-acetyl-gamma-glutamyl-phosphate reductase [Chloroflexota bacterium]|jgi:N-acetyl-gamma-glutamyl-phosphate/LysW-gamma-L-alpha-aminoadipyl-6-phosphate reductase|nr:N-acetyl-gamma-glutamyl-phosphate reductase [Chloroflexota bacterium]
MMPGRDVVTTRVSVAGGSGYTGGELIRLLLDHPDVALHQVTSERQAGKRITRAHPNLRSRTDLTFSPAASLEPCDVLFLAFPHGVAMERFPEFADLAPVIIDLSADFRLRKASDYVEWYGRAHANPDLLDEFVYGIPELHRAELRTAGRISSAGCLATAAILSLWPLFKAGLVDASKPVITEVKTGSSGSGADTGLASHHPERSGVIRSFKPTGHRHTAELLQELSSPRAGATPEISFSATSIEAVRGVLATSHLFTREKVDDKRLWQIFRAAYGSEPFIRIIKETQGNYRYPEPKILSGSNYCDVGFEADAHGNRVVVLGALDNLMKGAAGQAVQAMNIRIGYDEQAGLGFSGLHPI